MVKKMKNVLPSDIIESNILTRLPLKSLIRFTAVCKSWSFLPYDPSFINLRSQIHKTNKSNLLLVNYDNEKGLVVTKSCSNSLHSSFNDTATLTYNSVTVAGCCNGVVCVVGAKYDFLVIEYHIMLWNPALRINKIVGKYKERPNHYGVYNKDPCFGFGYHTINNEYNIAIFGGELSKIDTYSSISDSWEKIELAVANTNQFINYRVLQLGVYLSCCHGGGSYYWIVINKDNEGFLAEAGMISFDMEDKVFKEIMLPHTITPGRLEDISIFIYKDSLLALFSAPTLLDASTDELISKIVTIWVMKEYNDPNSWTKIFEFDSGCPCMKFLGVVHNDLIMLSYSGMTINSTSMITKEENLLDNDKTTMNTEISTKDITSFLKDAEGVSSFTESFGLLKQPLGRFEM